MKLRALTAVYALLLVALVAPLPARSTDLPDDVRQTVLPTGLTVLTKERTDPDAVAINVAVRAGSRDEDERTSGAAHFMEHMFFQGTPRRPTALEVQRPITSRGGTLNATTGWELINFDAVVRSADAATAVDVLADILINATFDPVDVEKERRVVLQELNARQNNPNTRGSDLFFQTIFANHPARHLPGGNRESVLAIDRDTLLQFRDRWFVANNMVVAIVGNISHDEAVQLVAREFAGLPSRPVPPRPVPGGGLRSAAVERVSGGTVQAQVLVGMGAPSMADADRHVMAVLDAAVDNAGRRLFTEIRDRRGLAYSVGSSVVALSDTGAWVAAAGVDPDNVELVTELILAEVHRLRDEPLTETELENAKSYLEGRYVLGLETNLGQARRFSGQEALGLREPIAQSIARVRAVTAADVQRVAQQYLDVDNHVRVVVEP
jgi:predicted Zn-dependent peptidase